MPKKNPHIRITVSMDTAKILTALAQKTGKTVSSIAREPLSESLERREDAALSALAENMDQEGVAVGTHDEAWR